MSEHDVDWEAEAVESHNRQQAWADIAGRLRVAQEQVEIAQERLDDLDEEGYAEQLQPVQDELRRAANDAKERAS